MSAVLHGNLAMACAQIHSLSASNKLYPGCVNVSHYPEHGADGGGGAMRHNDSSHTYSGGCDHYRSSLGYTGDYIVGAFFLCIIIPSIVMNSFVIWSFAVKRKTIVSVDYYILNLAISDLCSPVFAYPFAMLSTFSHRWIFGDTGCLINGFLGFFFGIVDIFILSTLSVTRYLCVCHPMAYARLTRSKVLLSLVGAVSVSFLWAAFPLAGWGEYGVEPFGTSCTLQWSTPDRAYVTSVFVACLVLPLLIMTFSYGSIIHTTSTASRRLRKFKSAPHTSSRRSRHEMKLIKVTVLMTVCFLLAWLPYAIVSMMSAYVEGVTVSGPTSIVPTLLAKTSHLSNPVIYFTMNSRFSHHAACCPLPFPSLPRSQDCSSAGSHESVRSRHAFVLNLVGAVRSKQQQQRKKSVVKIKKKRTATAATTATLLLRGGGGGGGGGEGGVSMGVECTVLTNHDARATVVSDIGVTCGGGGGGGGSGRRGSRRQSNNAQSGGTGSTSEETTLPPRSPMPELCHQETVSSTADVTM